MAATVDELLADARRRLARAPLEASSREAVWLLGHVLGLDEARILARGETAVDAAAQSRFASLLDRRLSGEPFAYVVGEREFFGRRFRVDPRVLIPRPETEHLVDAALELARTETLSDSPRILDLGTGSGCLAVTLALELAGASVVATDLSPAALAVARRNVARHGIESRVALAAADLADGLALETFDLVVSNPPYVEPEEAASVSPEILEHEPATALFPPGGGRAFYVRFFASLADLRSGVSVLTEIGYRQGPLVAALLQETVFELAAIRPDYAGHDRVVVARRR